MRARKLLSWILWFPFYSLGNLLKEEGGRQVQLLGIAIIALLIDNRFDRCNVYGIERVIILVTPKKYRPCPSKQ